MSAAGRHARWPAGALAVAAVLIAGCGSKSPVNSAPARAPVPVVGGATLATSASSANGTGWAIVKMGGSADALDNFWELFVRPTGISGWKLATPGGVASNSGLVMTPTGAMSLVTGFVPSQKLTFSPLAVTADGGAQWSQNNLLSPGFGDVPYALGASSSGDLLALTDSGDVDTSTNTGATWRTVTTERALAGSPTARACGMQALTAAAWTPAGSPLIAARCARPGVAGMFVLSTGAWRRVGPTVPADLSHDAVDIVGLATAGQRTTAILEAKSAARTSMVAAWSGDGGTTWSLSPALEAASSARPSVSIWADGSAGVVLSNNPATAATSGATIGWQSAGWHTLPLLPARTATLATGPSGQPQALAVSGSTLTAWQIETGRWRATQTIRVPVPYGSSG